MNEIFRERQEASLDSLTEGHEMDLFENLPFIYLMCQQNGFSALCVWILDLCPEINQNNISESVQRCFFFFFG